MTCNRVTRAVAASVAVALFVMSSPAGGQTTWQPLECPWSRTFNYTDGTFSYSDPMGARVTNISFTFGNGTFNDPGSSAGTYLFDPFTDWSGAFQLTNGYINMWCGQLGTYGPPRLPGDTDWTPDDQQGLDGGTVSWLYFAESATCDGIDVIYYDPDNPPPGCVGGGGAGPGDTVEVCITIVLTDQYGTPILDDSGNYIVLEDLGCSEM